MLTSRAWWFLVISGIVLAIGLIVPVRGLILLGIALMMWFGWEWVIFTVRLRATLRNLRIVRRIEDDRGRVNTLWTNRTFDVVFGVVLDGDSELSHIVATDFVPFSVVRMKGAPVASGPLDSEEPLVARYRIRCIGAGIARFEGCRVQFADAQGFFYHNEFLADPKEIPILPLLRTKEFRSHSDKKDNSLLPPGVHRLTRPGSGSELLDLRDYRPGDPPKTIAWKVSARRDKLITKEFESEVPIRCVLFLDTSNAVRIPALWMGKMPGADADDSTGLAKAWAGKPLHRLIEIATGVLQASSRIRDMAGLCLIDETDSKSALPGRSGRHLDRMFRLLAESTQQMPTDARVDPDILVPVAHALAQELYPTLMNAPANEMTFFVSWFSSFPIRSRHRAGWWEYFHRHKWWLLFFAGSIVPMVVYLLNWLLTLILPPKLQSDFLLASLVACGGFFALMGIIVAFVFVFSFHHRRMMSWRKRLAALLCVRYKLEPGCLDALLEDDDAFSLWLQHFLNEHHAPFALPLYDKSGRYRFASPEKVQVLAKALLRTMQHAQDNELYILLVDLLEVEDHLEPLLGAIRLAQSRHHQVMLICPWPPGSPPPDESASRSSEQRWLPDDDQPRPTTAEEEPSITLDEVEDLSVEDAVRSLGENRLHRAYRELKARLGKLGVRVVCAPSEDSVDLILDRMDRMRMAAGRRHAW